MGRKSSATEASLPPISEGEPRAGEPQPLAPELSKQKSSKNALGMSGARWQLIAVLFDIVVESIAVRPNTKHQW